MLKEPFEPVLRQGLALQHVQEAPADQKDAHLRVPGTSDLLDDLIWGVLSDASSASL